LEALEYLQLSEERVVNISGVSTISSLLLTFRIDEEMQLRAKTGLDRPFIMYTGGIDWRKNIERLIEAFSLMPDEFRRRFKLAIVCRIQDEERRRLKTLECTFRPLQITR